MNIDISLWHLVMEAGLLVKMVMLSLLVASIASWMIIFQKRQMLRTARLQADRFEEHFWSGADLARLFEGISKGEQQAQGMERIFEAGFREFMRMSQQGGMSASEMVDGAHRAMRIALTREMDKIDNHLTFLATVGSISPYVGLFGTVWGIMNAMRGLATATQATIQSVAPGISEALIATAMGLFAAIPAVIAYNRYSNQAERLELRYDNFKEELSTILQRQAHSLAKSDLAGSGEF
ncbi:MAG: protein TolQ [Xanthomonadales bacterium]|nr:protein TolQ [Xanthomonadales bacterium]